jgi:hypothetical protein
MMPLVMRHGVSGFFGTSLAPSSSTFPVQATLTIWLSVPWDVQAKHGETRRAGVGLPWASIPQTQ